MISRLIVEHIWDMIDHEIDSRINLSSNLQSDDFCQQMKIAWDEMSQ